MVEDVPERALRQLYLAPFEVALVDGGALGVMAAYPTVNGAAMTQNEALLRGR